MMMSLSDPVVEHQGNVTPQTSPNTPRPRAIAPLLSRISFVSAATHEAQNCVPPEAASQGHYITGLYKYKTR